MPELFENSIVDGVDEIYDQTEKSRIVLKQLLDEAKNTKGMHICIRGAMGTSGTQSGGANMVVSYSAMHTLEWIGNKNILMGSDMDFMKSMLNPETGKLEIDSQSAAEVRQRAPDWSRQKDLTAYLLSHQDRKFASILAVLSPPWVDDPTHENWGADGRAIASADQFTGLDSAGDIGVLNLNNTQAYALDGQHRVMGLRGLVELDQEGFFYERKKDGSFTKNKFEKHEVLAKAKVSISELRNMLAYEKINVEYIPAVVIGETREEAIRRVRSVFFAINKFAKKPDKGEEALLDENKGSALVAREILGHKLLNCPLTGKSRVNFKNSSVRENDFEFTTLVHLGELTDTYVKNMKQESGSFEWEPELGTLPLRPPAEELEEIKRELEGLLDKLADLPTFQYLTGGEEVSLLRGFPSEKSPSAMGNLLVRPIGLPIVIDAITRSLDGENDEHKVNAIVAKLIKYDKNGMFSSHNPASVFYGVTYDPHTNKMTIKHVKLAGRILSFLISGGDIVTRDDLIKEIIKCRSNADGEWMDENGERQVASESSTFPLEPIF